MTVSPDTLSLETDDALMRRVAERSDAAAFGTLVRRHQGKVLAYAARMLGDADTAGDIAQETFLRLWTGRTRYTPQSRLSGYLLSIAHHLCLTGVRSARRRNALPLDDCDAVAVSGAETGLGMAVRDAVLALPEEKRAVFVLSEYIGLSYAEIAEMLGIPAGTVASRKNHAVRELRAALADWQGVSTR